MIIRLYITKQFEMKLEIRGHQIIKRAVILFNGLTVLAGENDTGKSTIGKILFSVIGKYLFPNIRNKKRNNKNQQAKLEIEPAEIGFPVFIDSPDFLAKFNYLKNTMALSQQYQLNFSLPNEVGDLVLRISQPKVLTRHNKQYQKIKQLINGEVYYDSSADDIFYKKSGLKDKLNMYETSNGIKMFGFLQILILNETIKRGSTLILDEPEVHLHPKWQLEYAKIIVSLVKEGIKVLVTSHSPYMIEALELYAKKEKIATNFYLATKVDGTSVIEEVSDSLEQIYRTLAEPISILEELDDTE